MKVKFKCRFCKTENIFDTEATMVSLTEGKNYKGTDTYMPTCKKCGKTNAVDVRRK